ncbi:GDSL-type esterase/lipase family protein [Asticcacaulis sp. ZE23SCel15]|uniref:SGNH/GDSL hydrolase family protein n=1 Tax=Asticcacaulis sp. ZE23SCel15 TaxID=3059027 RepID=UPI00265F369B|nr:GDSL-type esterase/lipase family protein [Asticcacaulis sp. ZE23SCel15]WKL57229.1 GDSL-type esterase/lipase family protein [Asticcacaulis sp. ZE23SCel15]
MAYALFSDYVVSGGPVAAAAAPGSIGNGWRDLVGNVWSISAGNKLAANYAPASGATPWHSAVLMRQSSDAYKDSKIRVRFSVGASDQGSVWLNSRTSWAANSFSGYALGFTPTTGQFRITHFQNSVYQSTPWLVDVTHAALTVGAEYELEFETFQTNSTTTTLTARLFAADGVTQLFATTPVANTLSALQNVAAPNAVYIFQYQGKLDVVSISKIQVFNGDPASAYAVAGPSGGLTAVASSNFSVSANGALAANTVVTPSDGGAGGAFTPATVTLTNAVPVATFTYTPASAGAKTISFADDGGLTDPGNLTYTATAVTASAYTLSGPNSGAVGSASANFTVTADGPLAGPVVITPSDGAGGGSFMPATVTLNVGVLSGTFTYTPASAGVKTISTSDNAGLGDPASIAFTAAAAPLTLAVNSASFKFSPSNWRGDTGRIGSAWRRTYIPGAWFEVVWNGSAAPTAQLSIPATATTAKLSYIINGQLFDDVAATGPITLGNLVASGVNRLKVFVKSADMGGRWNGGVNTVRINGLIVDAGSSGGAAPAARPWVFVSGDSITEGWGTVPQSSLFAWVYYLSVALDNAGYDVGVDCASGADYIKPGSDVPAWYMVTAGVYADATSRWNKIDSGISRLDANGRISAYGETGQEPVAILVNYGTNAANTALSTADLQSSVTQWLTAARAAAPSAVLGTIMPFGLRYAGRFTQTYPTAIQAGITAYLTANANDPKAILIDADAAFARTFYSGLNMGGDNLHPTPHGQAFAGSHAT